MRSWLLVAMLMGVAPEVVAQDAAPPDATTAPAAETVPAAEAPVDKDASWDQEKEPGGLFGPVRVGPTLAVGFPHVVNYGIDVLWDGMIGFAIATGKTKIETFKPLSAEISNLDARLRWHPWSSAFFLGAAYGTQKVSADAAMVLKTTVSGVVVKVPTEFEATAETTYWTPHLGFFSVWEMGLTIGFELGMQMALKSHTSLDVSFKGLSAAEENEVKNSKVYKDQKAKTKEALQKIATENIPYVTLIRVGWMF